MANAGIMINLNITNTDETLPTYINGEEIETEEDNKPLDQYVFKIQKQNNIYLISFTLERPPIR